MALPSHLDQVQSETTRCHLCGHDDCTILYPSTIRRDLDSLEFTVFGEFEHTQIVQCKLCQLCYANPRDDPLSLRRIYECMPTNEYLSEESSRRWAFVSSLKRIQRYVPGGRVLDVGCSAGLFLESLPDEYERYGLELSYEAASIARIRGSGTILEKSVEEADFDAETCGMFLNIYPVHVRHYSKYGNGCAREGTF